VRESLEHSYSERPARAGKGVLMAFKLLDMAEHRWCRLDGRHLRRLVGAGVKFVDGGHREANHPIIQSTNNGPIHNI